MHLYSINAFSVIIYFLHLKKLKRIIFFWWNPSLVNATSVKPDPIPDGQVVLSVSFNNWFIFFVFTKSNRNTVLCFPVHALKR